MQEPKELRKKIREGAFHQPTSGYCPSYVQANVVIVPKQYAFDFFLFAYRNQQACPLIDVLDAGEYKSRLAIGSDIRTDVPRYRVYQNGELVNELSTIHDLWQDDMVTFLIGCSFTFESILIDEGIPLRHVEENKNVAMYVTNRPTDSTAVFHGPLVVSMRPIHRDLVKKAGDITAQHPNMHGAPVHIGDPSELGITDLSSPDFGEAVTIKEDEVPVFWACGVTPQMAAVQSKLPLMITHSPGHMFVTDVTNEEFLKK
ncbi:putative hydro-lyase [Alteribacillus sp. JSM 102045]|uniref:putative hydro-lyase n=1 Tax=Alteribacillus sp. JSM 102045 TaxID=1562101 RepID=UPI0035BEC5D4